MTKVEIPPKINSETATTTSWLQKRKTQLIESGGRIIISVIGGVFTGTSTLFLELAQNPDTSVLAGMVGFVVGVVALLLLTTNPEHQRRP